MSACWYSLRGPVKRASGAFGTVTIPVDASILRIRAFCGVSAASVQIFNDAAAVPLPASSGWFAIDYEHTNVKAPVGSNTIVFTSTTSYLVEYSTEGM